MSALPEVHRLKDLTCGGRFPASRAICKLRRARTARGMVSDFLSVLSGRNSTRLQGNGGEKNEPKKKLWLLLHT